jgi:hypothetical protein
MTTNEGQAHHETQDKHFSRRGTDPRVARRSAIRGRVSHGRDRGHRGPPGPIALRQIAEARGGIAKVAKAAGIERESLYRALSSRGNPRLSTLVAVTKAIGLKLTVEAA